MNIVKNCLQPLSKKCLCLILAFPMMASALSIEAYIPPFDVWLEASNANSEPAELIYSIALVESGKYVDANTFIPWPFAIGIGVDKSVGQYHHVSLYPETFEEAKLILEGLLSQGYTNIGVGIMQINIRFNSHLVDDPVHLLDPVTNIQAASKIIKQCNNERSDVEMLSCYSYGRYKSEGGTLYAKKVFDYRDRFGGQFVHQHQPVGELTMNELKHFWYQKGERVTFQPSSNLVTIVE